MHEALSETRPSIAVEDAAAIARERFGLSPRSITGIPGERDRNFRVEDADGERFVLKVMHPAEDPAVAEFQALALIHIAQADPSLPVPRVVPPVAGDSPVLARSPPYHVRCVTWLSGRPLGGGHASVPLLEDIGRSLARLDRALADFAHPADDHDLLWDVKRADRAASLQGSDHDEFVASVFERFERVIKPRLSGLRTQVIHNDFNLHNLLVSDTPPDRLAGVIDFGDMIRASLSQEVATAVAYHDSGGGHPLGTAARITAAYHAESPLSEDEIELIPDLMAVRLALSAVISAWRAALHPEEAGYILRAQPTVLANLRRIAARSDGDRFLELVDRLAS